MTSFSFIQMYVSFRSSVISEQTMTGEVIDYLWRFVFFYANIFYR